MRPLVFGAALMAMVVVASLGVAQQPTVPAEGAPVVSIGAGDVTVRRDSAVRMMVMREVTTKTARSGDRFPLHVDRDILVDGVTVIPAGTLAWGEVVTASESGIVGRSGKLSARLLYIELAGRRLPLRGEPMAVGTPGAATTAAATVGFALMGAGPLGLLTRGTNAKLKAGEIVTGFIAEDILIEPRRN